MKRNHRIMTAALVIVGILAIMAAGTVCEPYAAVRADHNNYTAEKTIQKTDAKAGQPLHWKAAVRKAVKAMEQAYQFSADFAADLVKSELTVLEDRATPLAEPQEGEGDAREEIEEAFTEPGPILVHNMEDLYADKVYEGYRRINEIRENGENFVIILDREAPDDGLREAD